MKEPTVAELQQEIRRLKDQKQALILAHNYQLPEVQEVADFVGDSLALAARAREAGEALLVFCGVHFMAETAAILNPDKRVLLPDLEAGCSLAESITAEDLRAWKQQHPGAVVVAYVNTSAEVKAESDYCCTSSNAVQVVQSLPEDQEILFVPDMYLGAYVASVTGRRLHLWPGECHVHAQIRPEHLKALLDQRPGAEFLIHPECGCSSSCLYFAQEGVLGSHAVHILSTGGMLRRARESEAREFVVATEVGLLYRLEQENPEKTFVPAHAEAVCPYMKKITLEKVLRSLQEEIYEVRVPEAVARRARRALERMLATPGVAEPRRAA